MNYENVMMKQFPQMKSVNVTEPHRAHPSVLDFLSTNLPLDYNRHFEVAMYNLSSIIEKRIKAIPQEQICRAMAGLSREYDGVMDKLKEACTAVVEACENDNVVLAFEYTFYHP